MVLNSIHTHILAQDELCIIPINGIMSFYVVLKLGSCFYCIILYFYRLRDHKMQSCIGRVSVTKIFMYYRKKPSSYFLIDQLGTY